MHTLAERYGPWALVTGAAMGLGAAFATELARRGVHVVLVDLDPRVGDTAARVAALGVEAVAVCVDLTESDALLRIDEAIGDRDVAVVVANAAVSTLGPFLDNPVDAYLRELDVNCRAVVRLVHHHGNRLATRGRGALVLCGSLSAVTACPGYAHYAATKAWTISLGESLWYELRPRGVDVVVPIIPATATEGYLAKAPVHEPVKAMAPERVAAAALDRLGRGPSFAVGLVGRALEVVAPLLPRSVRIGFMARSIERMYAPGDAATSRSR